MSTASPTARAETFLPGPILLLGAPGVGKGTQAKALMAAYGIPQISTGDILRANIAHGTDLGKRAKSLMDQGQLVADDIVNGMVATRLQAPDVTRGFILDGYPRTRQQAGFMETLLTSQQPSAESAASDGLHLPLVAVNIAVDEDELLRRITGRRSCVVCKHIYNIYSHPPKAAGICDFDGSPLEQRSDDTESAFHERMKEYRAKTQDVIQYFSQKTGQFETVNGDKPVEQVTAAIEAALLRLRTSKR
ncbi:MAG TPA: adenylate kinase [Edaphobacter sp.]|jgi:adenylate kinase|nr:adenylate kinase [Edaphobacter sp.]